MIPTGNVIVDIYAANPALARAAARNVVAINAPGGPDAPLPRARTDRSLQRPPLRLPGPEPAASAA